MRIRQLLQVLVVFLGSHAAAQVVGCIAEPHTLPDDLRSSLESRLAALLNVQTKGNWDDAAKLLENQNDSYNRCLISRMQELRMVSLDLPAPYLYTCTPKMQLPSGTIDRLTAKQLTWYVKGTATFQTSSETWVEETRVEAYRRQGDWYFIPPQQGMQEKWEKVHYTEADFARDRRDEIDIRNSPSSPIEIIDLHAHMIREFPSLRNIKFTLRNKTSKNVAAISVRIGSEGLKGFSEMDGPYAIKPGGTLTLEDDVPAYGDFCAGVWRSELVVREVEFADGSKWELKDPAPTEE